MDKQGEEKDSCNRGRCAEWRICVFCVSKTPHHTVPLASIWWWICSRVVYTKVWKQSASKDNHIQVPHAAKHPTCASLSKNTQPGRPLTPPWGGRKRTDSPRSVRKKKEGKSVRNTSGCNKHFKKSSGWIRGVSWWVSLVMSHLPDSNDWTLIRKLGSK